MCVCSAAEYARKLKTERGRMQDEAEVLRQEIEALQQSIRSLAVYSSCFKFIKLLGDRCAISLCLVICSDPNSPITVS